MNKKKGFFSSGLNIALVAVLVVLVTGIGILTYSIFKTENGVVAEDLSTKTPAEVEIWATSKGLKDQLTINYEYSETLAENTFISQDPKAGEVITDKLVVTYSKGKDPSFEIEVPTITSTTKLDEIEKWFAENGFTDVTVQYENNEEVEKDIVLRLNVTGKVKRSQPIIIYVSSGGDLDKIEIEVADFSNMTKEEVATWAKTHTATIEYTTDFSSTVAEGRVISQSIAAGTKIKASKTIGVVISKGKGIEILDFPGDKKATIQTWATKNNVKLEFVEEFSSSVKEGLCIRTEPSTGSYIAEGDTLTVYMSKGPKGTIVVPTDLLGTSESDFVAKIKALKLNPVKSSVTYFSTKLAARTIYSYDDGTFSEGDTVNYALSAGKFEVKDSEYLNMTESAARSIVNNYNARNAGATIKFNTKVNESTPGLTYACEHSGSNITCYIAEEEKYAVHNYTGQNDPCSESQCAFDNLIYKKTSEYSDTVAEGRVIRQSPSSGTYVKGTVINYVVSIGPKPIEKRYISSINGYRAGSTSCSTVDQTKAYMNEQLAGFTNITYKVEESEKSTGYILSISVNGDSKYSAGDYQIDTPIVITISQQYN